MITRMIKVLMIMGAMQFLIGGAAVYADSLKTGVNPNQHHINTTLSTSTRLWGDFLNFGN